MLKCNKLHYNIMEIIRQITLYQNGNCNENYIITYQKPLQRLCYNVIAVIMEFTL